MLEMRLGPNLIWLADKDPAAAGALFDFMEPLTELELEIISNKVLGRSKNLLATVRETLRERMITMENDTRTRLWSHPAADLGLLFDARHGILIGPEESMPVGKFSGC